MFLDRKASRNPVDRILAAPARAFGYTLVTRDRGIFWLTGPSAMHGSWQVDALERCAVKPNSLHHGDCPDVMREWPDGFPT